MTTTIYKVKSKNQLHPSDPLHVGWFYPGKERIHRRTMQDRQDLILYLSQIHSTAVKNTKPLGFCEVPMRLMSLREWVYDYKVALDHFFTIQNTGYNLGEGDHEISTLIPKPLQKTDKKTKLVYNLPERPDGCTISKVYVQKHNAELIRKQLITTKRLDLVAPVEWLLKHSSEEINFHFVRSGKLQQRDTSVWPICTIETWPSWLREALFGKGIDIESAYTQFLIQQLKIIYKGRERLLNSIYPDLIRSLDDKTEFRNELCLLLGLECNHQNLSTIKRLCMSLANGSKISPGILCDGRAYSVTADIIIHAAEDLSLENLERIGFRLQRISQQYSSARKAICAARLGLNPSRTNQKKVFSSYFEWEREARYELWKAIDCHGIMVHDGIDGVPEQYLSQLPTLIEQIGIKIST